MQVKNVGRHRNTFQIWEQVDPNLEIINYSQPYLTRSVSNIFYPDSVIDQNFSENSSQFLVYNISKVYPLESVIYSYWVKGTKAGSFNTYTIINSLGEGRSDYYYEYQLNVSEISPRFQYIYDIGKLAAEQNEDVPITYRLNYLGGFPRDSFEYPIAFDKSDRYILDRYFVPNQSFSKNNLSTISIIAKYPKAGVYSVPGLRIGGQYFTPSQFVTIKPKIEKYINSITISILSTAIALISLIANLYNKRDEAQSRANIEELQAKIKDISEKMNN